MAAEGKNKDRLDIEALAASTNQPHLLNPALEFPTTVVYRAGTMMKIDGVDCDYRVVLDVDLDAALGDGFFRTVKEAREDAATKPETKAGK